MRSSITIAASSICKHEIFTDWLNKIQLHTVWCSINFYFCSKQTMNVFFHCTFAWICVDFSCKTAFISYHVMSAKTRVLKCCCLLFDWTEFWESSALLNHESWLAYDDFSEKTWLHHGTKSIFFYVKDSILLKAFSSWFTSFSRVLPTSCVGYHASKPIESVVYCLTKANDDAPSDVNTMSQLWKLFSYFGKDWCWYGGFFVQNIPFTLPVILLPLRLHLRCRKNPQRRKIICGMCLVWHEGRLI